MPLYEYECGACGHRFEIIQKFSDGPPDACPKCSKGPLQRLLSSPAIQFKGSGWYITDYARKDAGKDAAKSSSGGSAPASDTAPSGSTAKKESGSSGSSSSGSSGKTD